MYHRKSLDLGSKNVHFDVEHDSELLRTDSGKGRQDLAANIPPSVRSLAILCSLIKADSIETETEESERVREGTRERG